MPYSGVAPATRALAAASNDHFNSLQCMLHTLSKADPTVPVLVVGLDATVGRKHAILEAANPRVTVETLDWTTMPEHARMRLQLKQKKDESPRAGHYAWKPLLINRELERAPAGTAIVWLDSEHKLSRLGTVVALAARARQLGGFYSWLTAGTVRQWTHRGMLSRMWNRTGGLLGRSAPRARALDEQHNCDGSMLVFVRGGAHTAALMRLWLACATDEGCIAPANSTRGNHRQDQVGVTAAQPRCNTQDLASIALAGSAHGGCVAAARRLHGGDTPGARHRRRTLVVLELVGHVNATCMHSQAALVLLELVGHVNATCMHSQAALTLVVLELVGRGSLSGGVCADSFAKYGVAKWFGRTLEGGRKCDRPCSCHRASHRAGEAPPARAGRRLGISWLPDIAAPLRVGGGHRAVARPLGSVALLSVGGVRSVEHSSVAASFRTMRSSLGEGRNRRVAAGCRPSDRPVRATWSRDRRVTAARPPRDHCMTAA